MKNYTLNNSPINHYRNGNTVKKINLEVFHSQELDKFTAFNIVDTWIQDLKNRNRDLEYTVERIKTFLEKVLRRKDISSSARNNATLLLDSVNKHWRNILEQ